ncbi:hypothetical protein, partial [Paenibacillus rigui]
SITLFFARPRQMVKRDSLHSCKENRHLYLPRIKNLPENADRQTACLLFLIQMIFLLILVY